MTFKKKAGKFNWILKLFGGKMGKGGEVFFLGEGWGKLGEVRGKLGAR